MAINPAASGRNTIVFQYNPETLKRSLEPQLTGGEGGQRSLAVRYTGAPVETIDLEVTIDAVDQLGTGLRGTYSVVRTAGASAPGGSPVISVRVTSALAQRHQRREMVWGASSAPGGKMVA